MKKIGVITFYKNNNYGANIQAFVLNKYLSNLGYKVLDIDYFYKGHEYASYTYLKLFRNIIKKTPKCLVLKETINYALLHKKRYPYIESFEKFRKEYIPQTKECKNVKDINKNCFDTIIIGSDQIWNTEITQGLDKIYFGQGLNAENIITYGASIGDDKFDIKYEKEIENYLKSIKSISTREINSQIYLKELTNREIDLVLDPVFLFEKSFYDNIVKESKININDKYILIYKLSDFPFVYDVADYFHNKTGYKIVEVSVRKKKRDNILLINNADPIDFINLIKNAEYVVTNSFHGTALSIILEKNFYTVDSKRPGRIDTLLELTKISNRKISDLNEIKLDSIDYTNVKNNLEEMINKSKNFLKNNI